jgi:hypothetical protein
MTPNEGLKKIEQYQKQKWFRYEIEGVEHKYTTEMLYKDVLKSLKNEKINLDMVADMGHFFFMTFDDSNIKDHKEIYESYLNTMNEALQTYWGPSAKATPDFSKRKIKCTCNDGREVYV